MNDDGSEHQFDSDMQKAGAIVPDEWRAGTLAAYRDMRRKAALLRQPRSAAAEPSNIFSLAPFLRKS